MNAYDAIHEQLQKAQSRGLEQLTDRLGSMADGLEQLARNAKETLDQVSNQGAEAAFPIADIADAVGELSRRAEEAEQRSRQAEERLADLESAPAAQATDGVVGLELLRRMDEARSQSDLLRELLPKLSEHAARAVVLVIRGDQVTAWSGIGFADGEVLRRWSGPVADSEALERFNADSRPVLFDPNQDGLFTGWLADGPAATQALLLPVSLRGKMMGAIYVDRTADSSWNPDTAQVLVALTCWMIDTLPHRQSVPAPMLAETIELHPSAADEVQPAEVDGDRWAPEPSLEVEESVEFSSEDDVATADEEPAVVDEVPVAEPETPEFDPSATMRVDVADLSAGAVPTMAVPPESPAPAEEPVVPETEDEEPADEPPPVSPVVPPPAAPAPEPAGDSGMSPEDEARHEEARRFARLLVSEIKLYNEEEVDRGRAGGDLYSRLKEDIDRSREMFEKRIPPEIRTARDYFHDELVRILADGNPEILGM